MRERGGLVDSSCILVRGEAAGVPRLLRGVRRPRFKLPLSSLHTIVMVMVIFIVILMVIFMIIFVVIFMVIFIVNFMVIGHGHWS